MKTKLFITGLAFFAVTSMGFAQDGQNSQQRQPNPQGKGYAFVDENKNGICDNFENGTPRQFRGKGQGCCNGQGMMQGRGKGQGQGQGQGNGRGKGPNFIDADNNGVCDRFEGNAKEGPSKK